MIALSSLPLDIPSHIAAVTHASAGGVNIFVGTIRDFNLTRDKKVIRMEYDAYEPMAIKEIQQIVDEAVLKFGVLKWAVSHRTGIVLPGEPAVVVAVATKHRKESFAACEFIIDMLKAKVPIWKKEVFEDGSAWL